MSMKEIFERISKGPVGTGLEVQNHQCLSSIAFEAETLWQDVWESEENEELRETRQHPNLLLPGDKVALPEKEPKDVEGESDQVHTFVMRGIPCALRLRFTKLGKPRAKEVYEIWQNNVRVDGGGGGRRRRAQVANTLDDAGMLELDCLIPTWEKITVLLGEEKEAYEFELGTIAPVTEPRGLQTRLWNLDYYRGPLSDEFTEETETAFRRFLMKNGMTDEVSQGIDEPSMKNALALMVNLHGC